MTSDDEYVSPNVRFAAVPSSALINEASRLELRCDEYWERVYALYSRGERAVFERAVGMLDSPEPAMRVLAADILAQLGHGNVPKWEFAVASLAVLIPLLESDESPDACQGYLDAIRYLIRDGHRRGIGSLAFARVLEFSRDSDPHLRWSAAATLDALSGCVDDAQGALAALVAMANDPADEVRDWVSFFLSLAVEPDREPEPAVVAALRSLVDDDLAIVRAQAINGLVKAGEPGVLPILLRIIAAESGNDEDDFCSDTLEAAAALADPILVPPLQRLRAAYLASGVDDYWMGMLDETLAACAGSDPLAPAGA